MASADTAGDGAQPATQVLFYGLNMDAGVLAQKGVHCTRLLPARLDGHAVVVRDKAILSPQPGACAYGTVASLRAADLDKLYAALSEYGSVRMVVYPFDAADPDGRRGEPIHALAMVRTPARLEADVDAHYLARWQLIMARLHLPFPDAFDRNMFERGPGRMPGLAACVY
ncbi:gamma-glutamylcyclotransferase (plasmid) [Massilia forsythiae]|uniref:Gamma-glutamylcyclotransferase n=1 Tax=Massilia forsythiae TaxID=2728020 RepID=A0A7Z2W3B3_9BURK|nr:gamma-glutamylcyclotransferase family protein [Massilia forsythiae]QJE03667.1 gamma-glutamylcyclotransferase [Massilia forsythiae]